MANLYLVLTFLIFQSCSPAKEFVFSGAKLRGVSMVAPPRKIENEPIKTIQKINANWISLMPYAFVDKEKIQVFRSYNNPNKNNFQWWGETPEGIVKCIKMAKKNGLKTMLKPHLWIGNGEFTGDLDFKNEADWTKFEAEYENYIMDFARIADSTNAEMLCIGTEMKTFVKNRSAFWFGLIKKIKSQYKGQLTYAENWDSYEAVPFWKELDFIGVDAYFPLSESKNLSKNDIKKGWKNWKVNLKTLAVDTQKPILFTEIGYQSQDFAGKAPWESQIIGLENQENQAIALQGLFENVWQEKWLAGIFVWKWFPENNRDQARDRYSPQNRKAEEILKLNYSK